MGASCWMTKVMNGWAAELVLGNLARLHEDVYSKDVPTQYVVITASSESESFTEKILSTLLESSVVNTNRLGSALIADNWSQFFQNWDARLKWLWRGFEIPNGTTQVQEVRTLVELRNSIVHGGGNLTRMQTGSLNKQLALEYRYRHQLDVTTEGGRLDFGSKTRIRAIEIAREFVFHIDNSARQRFPDVPL